MRDYTRGGNRGKIIFIEIYSGVKEDKYRLSSLRVQSESRMLFTGPEQKQRESIYKVFPLTDLRY